MAQQAARRELLGQILKARGIVREGQIQEALAEQRRHGGLIGQHLVALKHCTQADVAMALAEQAGLSVVDLKTVEPAPDALALIDGSTAHTYGVLPLSVRGKTLTVAIGDPLNTAVLEDLAFNTGLEIQGAVADAELLKQKVVACYGAEADLKDAIAEAARAATGGTAAEAAAS